VKVEDQRGRSTHVVRVAREDLDRYGRGRTVERLVEDSFEFLLQREPPSSILSEFDLSVIERYFPDYPRTI
jgi:hypothetical protein